MIYGIPNFKLEKEVVLRRMAVAARNPASGSSSNCAVGARCLRSPSCARGTTRCWWRPACTRRASIGGPGVGLPGIVPALDYLTASNREGLGDDVPGFDAGLLDAAGKNVVVIGGGDTAMDCVRTAVRQGAKSVKCLYRRDRANMPGSMREVKNAEDEGVEFVWLSAPEAFTRTTTR